MILALAAAIAAAQAPAAPARTCVTPQAFVCRALAGRARPAIREAAAAAFEQAASAQTERRGGEGAHAGRRRQHVDCSQPARKGGARARQGAWPGTGLQAEQRGEALLDRARAAEAQNDLKTARSKVNEAARSISEDPFLWYFSAALAIREGDAVTAKNGDRQGADARAERPDHPVRGRPRLSFRRRRGRGSELLVARCRGGPERQVRTGGARGAGAAEQARRRAKRAAPTK